MRDIGRKIQRYRLSRYGGSGALSAALAVGGARRVAAVGRPRERPQLGQLWSSSTKPAAARALAMTRGASRPRARTTDPGFNAREGAACEKKRHGAGRDHLPDRRRPRTPAGTAPDSSRDPAALADDRQGRRDRSAVFAVAMRPGATTWPESLRPSQVTSGPARSSVSPRAARSARHVGDERSLYPARSASMRSTVSPRGFGAADR